MLKVKVAAPPEKGKANLALIDFLAQVLGVKKTRSPSPTVKRIPSNASGSAA